MQQLQTLPYDEAKKLELSLIQSYTFYMDQVEKGTKSKESDQNESMNKEVKQETNIETEKGSEHSEEQSSQDRQKSLAETNCNQPPTSVLQGDSLAEFLEQNSRIEDSYQVS